MAAILKGEITEKWHWLGHATHFNGPNYQNPQYHGIPKSMDQYMVRSIHFIILPSFISTIYLSIDYKKREDVNEFPTLLFT